MASFPSVSYILKRQKSYLDKQKREETCKVKKQWYSIPKECRDRLHKEIRSAMYDILKTDTSCKSIDFQFSLFELDFIDNQRSLNIITEDSIHYFIHSFNKRMYSKDEKNENALYYWYLELANSNLKEFFQHKANKPLKLLLKIQRYLGKKEQ